MAEMYKCFSLHNSFEPVPHRAQFLMVQALCAYVKSAVNKMDLIEFEAVIRNV